jgi:hypothetical protein
MKDGAAIQEVLPMEFQEMQWHRLTLRGAARITITPRSFVCHNRRSLFLPA